MRRLQIENARLHEKGRFAREELRAKHDLCGIVYENEELHRVVSLAINVLTRYRVNPGRICLRSLRPWAAL